jgi:hypothetical protein
MTTAQYALMSVHIKNLEADPFADSFSHPLDERPYRMVVFSGFDRNHAPVYWVAGTTSAVMNAKNALSAAIKLHEGNCFFCSKTAKLTIDHAIPPEQRRHRYIVKPSG